jgi:hypothetical protein
VNSVAAQKSARPLYAEFLARVIKIETVQRERAAVAEEHTADFFELGRIPGVFGDFLWSLDTPEAFPWGPISPDKEPAPPSLPMQHAWDAAAVAWRNFIAGLANGEMIAKGMNPISGIRTEIGPFEWSRTDLVLDVRNGDLIEGYYGRPIGTHTVRWSAITLRPRQKDGRERQKKRAHGYDWEEAWTFAKTLRAEDKWNLEKHRRDKKQPLPAVHKTVEDKIVQWFASRGSVPNIGDIRRNIVVPLYAGRSTRGRRKR